MESDLDVTASEGLQFFGTISASISHEIKNILAILNENAGLLDDLITIAEKGAPLNYERIKSVSGTMKNQIKRADIIIKNLNSFAHSVDDPIRRIDIYETLELIVSLTGRFADMREVKLVLLNTTEKTSISSNPFFLENLIYLCIDFAIGSVGEERTVRISVEEEEKIILIKFAGLNALEGSTHDEFPTECGYTLINMLKADVEIDDSAGCIIIRLPENIDS